MGTTSLGQWPALVVTTGLHPGRSVTIGDDPVVVGCSPTADLVVEGRGVGRRHAEVFPAAGGVYVRNLGREITLLNGEPIPGPVLLLPGDALGVGDVTLWVGTVTTVPPPREPSDAEAIEVPTDEELASELLLPAVGLGVALVGFVIWIVVILSKALESDANTGQSILGEKGAWLSVALFVLGGAVAGYGQWSSKRKGT